jgi:hypothetical protein
MQASVQHDSFLRVCSVRTARDGTRPPSLRALLAAAVSTCVLVMLAPGTGAAAIAPCPDAFGSFSSRHEPTACWRPYGPMSPFNMPLPSSPRLAPKSQAIVARIVALGDHFEGGPGKFAFVSAGRGAVYYSSPSDPRVTIDCTARWGPNTCQGADGVDLNGASIHVPAGAQTQPAEDHHLTIIDQAAGLEYDFELASFSGDRTVLTTAAASEIPIGPDRGTGLGSQGTASHFGTIAGLITEPELAAGEINHALVASIPCTEGYVWPAIGPFGYPCSKMSAGGQAAPALGTLFQLHMSDAQIATSGAPYWEQAIMTAMARYGMYANDTNGPGNPVTFEIEKEDDISYTSVGGPPLMADLLQSFGGTYWGPGGYWIGWGLPIDFSKLRVIDPCVDRRTCPSATQSQVRQPGVRRVLRSHRRTLRHSRRHQRSS